MVCGAGSGVECFRFSKWSKCLKRLERKGNGIEMATLRLMVVLVGGSLEYPGNRQGTVASALDGVDHIEKLGQEGAPRVDPTNGSKALNEPEISSQTISD